jgi:hypothetical protein
VKKKMSGGQTLQNGSREFLKISLKNNLKKKKSPSGKLQGSLQASEIGQYISQ